MCECLQLTIEANGFPESVLQSNASGVYNGENYWEYDYNGIIIVIWFIGGRWNSTPVLGVFPIYTSLQSFVSCPVAILGTTIGVDWLDIGGFTSIKTFTTAECPEDNCGNQDRTFKRYNSIRLPEIFQEQNRGLKECCCTYQVLGDSTDDAYKNDKSSAWIKLSDSSDTVTFILKKNGVNATYTPTTNLFINEENAKYTTVDWGAVMVSDGVGCYTIEIEYSISGIVGSLIWGTYNLQPYSIQNALHTARVRVIFNGYQEIEQINFSGSQVESTFRFFGYIGNRQPNTEIDNIIYGNREMKRVKRENLNSYEIVTDPSDECITRPLIDLYLLSENQLFISDYNAHNHSYRYQDIPVIVDESPELEYYDFSRKAKLSCKVTDKFKNKRTYY